MHSDFGEFRWQLVGRVVVAGQIGSNGNSQSTGCLVLFLVVAALFIIGKCSSGSQESSGNQSGPYSSGGPPTENMTAQSPRALEPLSLTSARLGFRHFRLSDGAEGIAGATIYSQNCYDALSRSFSWSKLDTCGAFDMAATQAIESETGATTEQSAYFEPETAAGRYLSAAIGAGEPAADADRRLSALQRLRPKVSVPDEKPDESMASAEPAVLPMPDVNSIANLSEQLED